jgi:FkbM family methyltransferase
MTTKTSTVRVPDQRGAAKQLKRVLPTPLFRVLTRAFTRALAPVPFAVKYRVGLALVKGKAPYAFIRDDDHVVQVGAPRDILQTGRSRAVRLSLLARRGRVLVVEPDRESCAALTQVIARHRLGNIALAPVGAWHAATKLTFLSSPSHPASNLLEGVEEIPEDLYRTRQYTRTIVPVDTIDAIASRHGITRPRLVSLTTNGSELQILAGMRGMLAEGHPEYLSLASTGAGYVERLRELGYDYIARDDRGYCFRRRR